ncbi:MAG: hypothetical protein ACAH89_06795 [Rariglobus sp.]|nr:hypothetical protein [Rariglobus sp.]
MSVAALQLKKTLANAIREKMASDDLNVTAFAKKTKTGRNSVLRILDAKNTSITLNTMAKAAKALNLELTLSVRPLPLSNLKKIAGQLSEATDAKKADALKKQFLEGYYGNKLHAQNSAV